MRRHSRLLEEPPHTAAHQQEELLGEEDPGDLLHRGPGLTPQVQDGGSQEGDAQAEAEEDAPVGEGLLQVLLQQGPELLPHQRHLAPSQQLQLHSHGRLEELCCLGGATCQQIESIKLWDSQQLTGTSRPTGWLVHSCVLVLTNVYFSEKMKLKKSVNVSLQVIMN